MLITHTHIFSGVVLPVQRLFHRVLTIVNKILSTSYIFFFSGDLKTCFVKSQNLTPSLSQVLPIISDKKTFWIVLIRVKLSLVVLYKASG